MGDNIDITKDELDLIRSLEDFDLTMFLSELHQFGWIGTGRAPGARNLLPLIANSLHVRQAGEPSSFGQEKGRPRITLADFREWQRKQKQ